MWRSRAVVLARAIGAQTKCPATLQLERKHPWDVTSGGTKRLAGQNVQKTKHPWGQNFWRDKTSEDTHIKKHPETHIKNIGDTTSFWLIFNTYILKTSIIILYHIAYKLIAPHTCRKPYSFHYNSLSKRK